MTMKLIVEIPEQTSQRIEQLGMSPQELTDIFLRWVQLYLNTPSTTEITVLPNQNADLIYPTTQSQGSIRDAEYFGMWQERPDMEGLSSREWLEQQRTRQWIRP